MSSEMRSIVKRPAGRQTQAADIRVKLTVSFVEAVYGAEKQVNVQGKKHRD